MKRFVAILLLLLAPASLFAQQNPPKSSVQPAAASTSPLEDWLNDNIDPDVLRALNDLDDDKVQKLLSELQQAMNGTNIYQLTTLRQTATQIIPILEKYDETAPFADWLQTRLDYLEAAQELEREVKAAHPQAPATAPLPAPTLTMERQVWKRVLERRPWPSQANDYIPELKAAFIAQRAPPELVWLAEVESSFRPRARSPAGAAGMFQLMPQTAKDQQLSLWPWDERLQPVKSAGAAARYLRTLHDHYGDWQLALAAYNVGPGRIDKLLKQQNAHTFDAIARRLPVETQMYVPKVEATIRQREGLELQNLKMPGG